MKSTTPCILISHDEEHFASSGREGIPTPSAMSRDGLVVDELGAVPSVNERISIRIVFRSFRICNSNINSAVSVDGVWASKKI